MVKHLLLILNLIATAMTVHADGLSKAYIYDSVDDPRAIVFNLNGGSFTFQDKNFVHIDEITEFGGSLQVCGDPEYFCLSGSIDLVIPKVLSSMNWTYHGVTCSSNLLSRYSGVYKISCLGPGRDSGTEVEYSSFHGVISISDGAPGDQTRFELRGECGFFASGCGNHGRSDKQE